MNNTDQIAIITGGGGWIGRSIARRLSAAGIIVALADHDHVKAEEAAAAIAIDAGHERAFALAVDICDPDSCERMVASVIERCGRIDILVNSAGGSARKQISRFQDADRAVLDRIIDLNLKGPVFCTRAVIGHMIDRGSGRIINMASITGIQGLENVVDYSAAKGGVIAFTKALAKEVGPQGITVNAVSPGLVPRPEEDPARALRSNYLGRVCQADDVAELVGFLCGPGAGFITGHNHVIDGGRSLGMKS